MRKPGIFIISLSIVNCQLSIAFADELSAVHTQIESAKKEDARISGRIEEGEKIVLQTRRELVRAAGELSRLESEKTAVEGKIRALEKKQSALLVKIRATDAHLADASAALVAVGATGVRMDSNDAGKYALAMAALSAISERFDADMKIAVAEVRELERLSKRLEKEHGAFILAERKYKKEEKELDNLLRARANQNQALRGRQYELQKRLGALSARAKSLSELADKVAPASSIDSDGAAPPADFGARKMRFPASGMLLLRFGELGASGLRSDGWHARARPNAVVAAPADGRIEFADYFRGHGRVAIINHNDGYYSVITGMDGLSVLVGQDVLAGEPIGRMPERNADIYLELRFGTRAVDPARMFLEPR